MFNSIDFRESSLSQETVYLVPANRLTLKKQSHLIYLFVAADVITGFFLEPVAKLNFE